MKQTHQKGIFENNYDYFSNHHRHNFQKVADSNNWKMPTSALIVNSMEEAEAIRNAVIYFTGTVAEISRLSPNKFGVNHADGYYVGIGA